MKLLLDTHALVWWLNDDRRLSTAANAAISAGDNICLVSAASAWEVATKVRKGRWPEAEELFKEYVAALRENDLVSLQITEEHALLAGSFDVDHKDPIDRILAAQAQTEAAVLVSVDPAFARFNVQTLW